MNTALKAGFGRADITPEPGVRLGGYSILERPAERVLDPLHATAVVLEQDSVKAAIINLDWICIEESTVADIREKVRELTGIPETNIMICTTHTHSAPNTLNAWGWGEIEQKYIESVIPGIAEAVVAAKKNLVAAEVGFGVTKSDVGVNRRYVNPEGEYLLAHNLSGPYDPNMTVVRFQGKNGPIGSIVHYGAHNTCMGVTRDVSRDWCGVMKDRVEKQTGAPVLYVNGAIGDVGPRTNYIHPAHKLPSAGAGDGIEAVREVGYRAATDAIRAWLGIKSFSGNLKLDVVSTDFNIAFAPLMPQKEAKEKLKKYESFKDKTGKENTEYRHAQAVIAAYCNPIETGRIFRQSIVRLGPLAFVPFPGEVFSEIVLRLRSASPFQYTLCASGTNGSWGYLPSRSARFKPCYAVWMAIAYGAYVLCDDIDDQLVRQNLELLETIR